MLMIVSMFSLAYESNTIQETDLVQEETKWPTKAER